MSVAAARRLALAAIRWAANSSRMGALAERDTEPIEKMRRAYAAGFLDGAKAESAPLVSAIAAAAESLDSLPSTIEEADDLMSAVRGTLVEALPPEHPLRRVMW